MTPCHVSTLYFPEEKLLILWVSLHETLGGCLGGLEPRKAVYIVKNPEKIRLIADFQRSAILRHLARSPMTETELSELLGLTRASVGYHLHLLSEAGLIRVERTEPEGHGILQKYYGPIAFLFIADFDLIPDDARNYFIALQMERLRGALAAFQIQSGRQIEVSSQILEELAEEALKELTKVAEAYGKEGALDREIIALKIHSEVLGRLMKEEKWSQYFKK